MRDLLHEYDRLSATGQPVGRAVVTEVWGSAPRPPGACLVATPDGSIAGSVSGGCVESATAQAIAAAIERGAVATTSFGVTDESAWEVGLACGGTLGLLIEPAVRSELVNALRSESGFVWVTATTGEALGEAMLVDETGRVMGTFAPVGAGAGHAASLEPFADPIEEAAVAALRQGKSGVATVETADKRKTIAVFLEVHPRPPRLVIFGGVHVAAALVPLARVLGFRTIVADGRAAFANRERFPDADEVVVGWPREAFDQIGIDAATYVCVLSHDPKFDDPALEIALRSPAAYIGAIGSHKNQAKRRARLLAAGFTEDDLSRLRGPIGLDLGGRRPAETALAILAEMTALRHGRGGGSLTQP